MSEQELIKAPVQTRMISPTKKEKVPEKMVKIEALMTISVGEEIFSPGTVLEVPESLAKDFCKTIECHYAHNSFMDTEKAPRHKKTRAKLVA